MKLVLGAALALVLSQSAMSAPLASYLVKPESDAAMQEIAKRFEVTHKHGDAYEVYVPANRSVELLSLAPRAEMLEADTQATIKYLERHQPEYMAGYRSWAQVQDYMKKLAADHPEIVKLEQYGSTGGGKPLYALKLSDAVATDESEPEVLLTSATHGDELITVEVLLTLLQELVDGYGKDPRLTAMVDDKELYFIPVVNPDGFSQRSRYAEGGVDPNRDYPWPGNPSKRPIASIAKLITFYEAREFRGSLDMHASGKLVMYPWAYTQNEVESADALAYRNLGREMAEVNRYTAGQISRILYVAQGSSADYYHWKTGALAFAAELATTKVPATTQIPAVVTEAREMTWRFIEHF